MLPVSTPDEGMTVPRKSLKNKKPQSEEVFFQNGASLPQS
jgi:hypothetical protein